MTSTVYDEQPYESFPYPESHPERLSVIAQLFGLSTPRLKQFRLLELGCAAGGNLMPMAVQYPDSEFIGIDYAQTQVSLGVRSVNDLGLTNLHLKVLDILDLNEELGQFDFIIAHGIYSWVPETVRNQMLRICREHLKPEGLAYVSYNTYPGWKSRGTVRDMMLFHTRDCTSLSERVDRALDFLRMLNQSFDSNQNSYALMLKQELKFALSTTPEEIHHDYLEETNNPVYFYQFNAHLEANTLKYVGDCYFHMMRTVNLTEDVIHALTTKHDGIVEIEQYMDYSRNRYFRRSILTHQGREIKRLVQKKALTKLFFSLSANAKSRDINIQAGVAVTFALTSGNTVRSDHPITKCVLAELAAYWPKTHSFASLLKIVRDRLKKKMPDIEFETVLIDHLLQCYSVGVLDVYTENLAVCNKAGDRPRCSNLARYQAKRQKWVVNQRHEYRMLDDFSRQLLQLLDGTRNKKQLRTELESLVKQGVLPLLDTQNTLVTDNTVIAQTVRQTLDRTFISLAEHALLLE